MKTLHYIGATMGALALATSLMGANIHSSHAAGTTDTASTAVLTVAGYSIQPVAYPGDTFTQLLGINTAGTIAGYHGSGQDAAHPNKGFVLNLANPASPVFTAENYPGSVQTQVIGINNYGYTDGFYVDSAGANHGFRLIAGSYATADVPGTTFNQLLGTNDLNQVVGYYQFGANNVFQPYISLHGSYILPIIANAQATGINNAGLVSGFSAATGRGFLYQELGIPASAKILSFPQSASTAALGLNNVGQAVGSYNDNQGNTHGFVYNESTNT
ncbi:MAG TPA: hypothetical protein VHB98_03795, partial [Chloroflexota bacterium]|nr:hypothetical protein [Chloroflexota bacterium]